MAKVQFGSQIVNMSGKLGGQVYSHNASGAYIRNIGTIAVAPSAGILAARTRMASIVASWKALTNAQRNAWASAVVNYQRLDVFANVYTLNGYGLFCAINLRLLSIGQPILYFPAFPVQPPAVPSPSFYQVELDGTLWFTAGISAIPVGISWLVDTTAPLSPTLNNVNVFYSKLAALGASLALPTEATAAYIAKYGAITPGLRLNARITPIHIASGTSGLPSFCNLILI